MKNDITNTGKIQDLFVKHLDNFLISYKKISTWIGKDVIKNIVYQFGNFKKVLKEISYDDKKNTSGGIYTKGKIKLYMKENMMKITIF